MTRLPRRSFLLAGGAALLAFTLPGLAQTQAAPRNRAIFQIGDDDPLRWTMVLNNMAMHAFYVSEWETAIEYYGRAEEMARRSGEVIGTGIAALNHGELRLNQGRLEEAHQLLESALRTFRAAKYPIGE